MVAFLETKTWFNMSDNLPVVTNVNLLELNFTSSTGLDTNICTCRAHGCICICVISFSKQEEEKFNASLYIMLISGQSVG